jgi:hypothetical protein
VDYNQAVTTGETVIFPGVYTNIGGHYDNTNGYFSCPVQGIYLFALTFVTDPNIGISLQILKSTNSIIAYYPSSHANDDNYETGASVLIMECSQNSVVYVNSLGTGTIAGRYHSTFSGYLLQIS